MPMRKTQLRSALAASALAFCASTAYSADAQTILGSSSQSECLAAAATAEQSGQASASGLQACHEAIATGSPTVSERAAAFLSRGVIHLARGENVLAIKDFDHALTLKPSLSAALNDRGIAHYGLRQYDLATSDFTAALALNPDHPERVLFNRALAYEDQQDLKHAYLDYRQAAELNPAWDKPAHELARFTLARSPTS
jgi:tetratricopeptide (TPR) repeat protein